MMMRHISFVIVIFLFAGAIKINGDGIKGRLLTPEEGCGLTKVRNARIVGGSEAPVGAWPWMALLVYEKLNQTSFHCGASLITSRHLLTAAHCITPGLRFARLGELSLKTINDGPHQDIPIARSMPHQKFSEMLKKNDIAVIELARDVEFSDKIRPICLPLDEPLQSRSFVNTNPFVAGFGLTAERGPKAQVLLQLQVPVIDTAICRENVYKIGASLAHIQVKDHVICAGGSGGKGVWKGDSGGPLMLPLYHNGTTSSKNLFPFYQIGIVSFTYRMAQENVPDIYTKVQYYADWIKFQLRNSTKNAHTKK